MRVLPFVEGTLKEAWASPQWVRIETSEMGRVLYRQCHLHLITQDGSVDLYRIDGRGKIERFASINQVSVVEEVDGPPAVEALPNSSTAVAEDDIPL
jgi:hypothetical protein